MQLEIDKILRQALANAFQELFQLNVQASDLPLLATKKEFEGHRTLTVFAYTKPTGQKPEDLAHQLGKYLQENLAQVSGYNVIKGFLNIVVADSYWASAFEAALLKPDFGSAPPKNEKVVVEYSSPNTNKPIHLGHTRNNSLGYALSQILKTAGYEVTMTNLVNDRGIHICKSMIAYQRFGNGETPASAGIKGDHLVGKYYVEFDKAYKAEISELVEKGHTEEQAKKEAPIMKAAQAMLQAWEANDPETVNLWKLMNGWVYEGFEATYKRMGVTFDHYYYESNTYLLGKDIVEEGLQKGVFYRRPDGSVWCDLTADGLDEKLVLRADGTSVYITQDLGTADLKYKDFNCNRSIYVVGNEQDYHFRVLFLILKKLGRPYAEGLYHLSYGMVNLPSGKMKSREGTVVDADELMDDLVATARERTQELGKIAELESAEAEALFHKLGLGALKYFLLKVEPQKTMLFNPEESIDMQGNTATFIQYTHARVSSILRKASQMGLQWKGIAPETLQTAEGELIRLLLNYPVKIEEAAKEYSPAVVANYLYEVAREYNRFFTDLSIFKAENENLMGFRVAISALTGRVLRSAGGLLGIEMPERM